MLPLPGLTHLFHACSHGDNIAEHLDEDVFARMTDEEYYELQGLINDTRQPESFSH
jgi:hypothetical protein